MTSTDLAIVGGGPAGLATAICARLAGLSVALFDRSRLPIDKACGEGLMPNGVSFLDRIGIDSRTLGRPFAGIRYIDRDREATGRFDIGTGMGIRRTRLQAALAHRAEELGASLHWSCAVTGLDHQGVTTAAHGDLGANWIVGADGLNSRVREWLGIETHRGRPRFGLRRHFEIEPWTDLVEVHWGTECEAYVTPVGDREVGVTLLRGGSKALFEELLTRFPRLARRLADAPMTSRHRGAGPLWSIPEDVIHGNAALVGDAAGYLDAITGEGLSMAFQQSEALVHSLLTSGGLDEYRKAVRALALFPNALIRALLFIERRTSLRRRLIRTLADDPVLFSRLLAVHSRQIRPVQLGAVNLSRLLLGLARPA